MRFLKFIKEKQEVDMFSPNISNMDTRKFSFEPKTREEKSFLERGLNNIVKIFLGERKDVMNKAGYCYNVVAKEIKKQPENYFINIIGKEIPMHTFITDKDNKIVVDSMKKDGLSLWPIQYNLNVMVNYRIMIKDFLKYSEDFKNENKK